MASKTNLLDVFDSIESIDKTSENAQVEGILCNMKDPKRGSKRFFHGHISDGTKRMRLVGFEDLQQKSLQDFDAAKSPVKISSCEVQRSTYSGELEIKLTSKSAILKSPKKFDSISDLHSNSTFIQVSEAYNRANSDRINLKVKVTEVKPPCSVSTGKVKQDLVIADCIKVTVWEDMVGKIELLHCYELQQIFIRTYNGIKFLSYPKEGGSFTEISDIGDVVKQGDGSSHTKSSNDIHNAVICGVSRLFKYRSCVKCRSKVEQTSTRLGRCTNASCKMLQHLDKAKETFSAFLMLTYFNESTNSQTDCEVHAFETDLRKITAIEEEDISEEDLLDSNPFSCCTNAKNVITSVWKP